MCACGPPTSTTGSEFLDPAGGPDPRVGLGVGQDVDVPGRVVGDDALADGEVERGTQGGTEVLHR